MGPILNGLKATVLFACFASGFAGCRTTADTSRAKDSGVSPLAEAKATRTCTAAISHGAGKFYVVHFYATANGYEHDVEIEVKDGSDAAPESVAHFDDPLVSQTNDRLVFVKFDKDGSGFRFVRHVRGHEGELEFLRAADDLPPAKGFRCE